MTAIKTVTYTTQENAVRAYCRQPRPGCLLHKVFTPLPNLLVMNNKTASGKLEVIVFLRNKHTYDVSIGKAQILDVMKQTCQHCYKQRLK